jgi:hypothetical protein
MKKAFFDKKSLGLEMRNVGKGGGYDGEKL